MKPFLLACLLAMACPLLAAEFTGDEWVALFDGKSLEGWKASEQPGTFSVVDGELVVHGPRSHLFYVGPVHGHDWKNFELKAEIMTRKGANSGVYFHTEYQEKGFPDKGYEVQVNNTHPDRKKTAGLYDIQDNFADVAKDDVWFTMTIKVEGKHVVTAVDGKVVADYTEEENAKRAANHTRRLISNGTFALQGHDPGSEVHFKSIKVRALP